MTWLPIRGVLKCMSWQTSAMPPYKKPARKKGMAVFWIHFKLDLARLEFKRDFSNWMDIGLFSLYRIHHFYMQWYFGNFKGNEKSNSRSTIRSTQTCCKGYFGIKSPFSVWQRNSLLCMYDCQFQLWKWWFFHMPLLLIVMLLMEQSGVFSAYIFFWNL